jgi:putative methionine-R-sulfoxide reductase with GAF domain
MPMSAHEVRQALHELDDLRYAAGNLDEALRRIVDATHQLFAVDGAGLMLIDPDQLLRNIAVSDQRVDHLEELQIKHGEGPCVDAFEEKELVHADDLAAEDRWPKFCPAAVERGLRAVLASPIPYNQHAIGVVVVFSAKAQPWSPEGELALGRVSRIASRLVGSGAQPDEDVRDSNGGLVAGGELVKAGRDRPELLAAVHQPLHLIPVAGAGPVKGRRPTAPGTTTGPVGRLIITLRDRVADAAGPQRRPVGAAAVGLIAGQVIRSRARPPTTAGPSHPHLVHQPDQLGGVSVLPRGQPGGQVAATPIADRVELGGQPTP